MTPRRVLTVLTLFAIALLERFGYYAFRAVFALHLMQDREYSAARMGKTMVAFTAFMYVAPIFGGALALALRARVTSALGAAVACGGYLVLAMNGNLPLGLAVVALGVGMVKPAIWAIAAEEIAREIAPSGVDPADVPLSPRRFPAMAGAAAILYTAIDVGAFFAPMAGGALRERTSFSAVCDLAAGAMIGCAILATALALVPLVRGRAAPVPLTPYRGQAAPPLAPRRAGDVWRGIAGVALLLAATAPFSFTLGLASSYPRLMYGASQRTISLLFAINPLVATIASVAAAVAFLLLAAGRRAAPLTWVVGGALVVHACGLAVLAGAGDSLTVYALGASIIALAEPAVGAVTIAYAALVAPPRAAPLVVASWISLTGALSMFGDAGFESRGVLLVLCAVLCLASGAILLARGRAFHGAFFADRRA